MLDPALEHAPVAQADAGRHRLVVPAPSFRRQLHRDARQQRAERRPVDHGRCEVATA